MDTDTRVKFTRTQIAKALDAADASIIIPPEAYYARRIDDAQATCLAYQPENPTDYGMFVTLVGALTGTGSVAAVQAFAEAAEYVPFSRPQTVIWPSYRLDEPTDEEQTYLPPDVCAADPDGLHHVGCGCDPSPISPAAVVEHVLAGAR